MTCPKHDDTNGHVSWKAKQVTIKVNAKIKVFKLNLSFFTYAKLICQVKQRNLTKFLFSLPWLHLQCCVLKKSQCHMTGLPWGIDNAHNNNKGIKLTQDIQRSNEHVQVIQNAKVGMIQFSLVFFTILGDTSITT